MNKADTGKTETAEPECVDIFGDLSKLRLDQNFHEQIGVQKALLRVPVRKPKPQEFIRVRPEPEFMLETGLLEMKEDREFYLLDPALRDQLPEDWTPVRLVTCINRQGTVFLWPLKLPDPNGRANGWYTTAIAGADLAETRWVKIKANMGLGGYDTLVANGALSEPEWPEHDFQRLLAIAFRDLVIRDVDHPVIRRLLGYE